MKREPEWAAIMAAVEDPPGTWSMTAPNGHIYGTIEIRRTADGIRYKTTRNGQTYGWATTLREACHRLHMAYLAAHGPSGGARADWGELTGHARAGTTKDAPPPTG